MIINKDENKWKKIKLPKEALAASNISTVWKWTSKSHEYIFNGPILSDAETFCMQCRQPKYFQNLLLLLSTIYFTKETSKPFFIENQLIHPLIEMNRIIFCICTIIA